MNRLKSLWPHAESEEATDSLRTSWGETAKSWEHGFEHFLGDHPKVTLVAAAALGLMLGLLVKRR